MTGRNSSWMVEPLIEMVLMKKNIQWTVQSVSICDIDIVESSNLYKDKDIIGKRTDLSKCGNWSTALALGLFEGKCYPMPLLLKDGATWIVLCGILHTYAAKEADVADLDAYCIEVSDEEAVSLLTEFNSDLKNLIKKPYKGDLIKRKSHHKRATLERPRDYVTPVTQLLADMQWHPFSEIFSLLEKQIRPDVAMTQYINDHDRKRKNKTPDSRDNDTKIAFGKRAIIKRSLLNMIDNDVIWMREVDNEDEYALVETTMPRGSN